MLRHPCRRPHGVAALEFQVVAIVAVVPLLLGLLQGALLLVASQQLDYAATMAARSGSFAGADAAVIERALARHLVVALPGPAVAGNGEDVLAATAAAFARARLEVTLHVHVERLSPTREMLEDFAVMRDGRRELPNDSLEHRPVAPGARSGVTLQQANTLRLRVTWCHAPLVPLARELLLATLRGLDLRPAGQRCYLAGRLPLVADAVMPMQSPVVVP